MEQEPFLQPDMPDDDEDEDTPWHLAAQWEPEDWPEDCAGPMWRMWQDLLEEDDDG